MAEKHAQVTEDRLSVFTAELRVDLAQLEESDREHPADVVREAIDSIDAAAEALKRLREKLEVEVVQVVDLLLLQRMADGCAADLEHVSAELEFWFKAAEWREPLEYPAVSRPVEV